MVASHAHDRAVRRQLVQRGVQRLEHRLLLKRILRVAGRVGAFLMDEDERVSRIEPLASERDSPAEVVGRVLGLRSLDRLERNGAREAAQKRRLGRECSPQAVPLLERRHLARPSPPLERDHVEPLALEPAHDLARPPLGGARRPFGFLHERLRPQQWMSRAEERVRVRDPLVRAAGDAQHGFATPHMRERERQAVDLDAVTRGDEASRVVAVRNRIRAARQPPAVVTPFRRAKRGVREHVLRAHVLVPSERLEHGSPRKLVGPVAEHRPVRDLARRRTTGADRVDDAARSRRAQPIEVRRLRCLDSGASPERHVRAVGDAVEQDDDDRMELHTGIRCSERITRATPGGTSPSQSPPSLIASRTSRPEISFSTPSSRMTTS